MGHYKNKAITGYRGLFIIFIVFFHMGGEFEYIGNQIIRVLYKEGEILAMLFLYV